MGASKSKLLTTEFMDELILATDFKAPEITEIHDKFMVACPSGKLNPVKFQELYTVVFPHGNPHVFSDYVFTCFDENGDRKIDFREFLCALHVIARGTIDQKINWMFRMYDQDKNGEIDRTEMKDLVEVLYELYGRETLEAKFSMTSEALARNLLSTMDLNNDGKISLEEFRVAVKEGNSFLRCILDTDPHTCLKI
ncbi:unnamed protein product [Allacma fusca]|uniref:EF-hand domain-containing protein n=1 Tax=Allacma fusca TaxID=39272 RepID=A0A8J2K5Z7_9HEXA|nr:unnamed protein product [Allacma fusca]